MQAPDFTLLDQNNKEHTLSDYSGKWLVLYFYPKDDTPGCTTEACNFRDGREVLEKMGVAVVGVSRDSVKSHAKFVNKYDLQFTLLSDPDHKVIEAYGSWKPKRFMGRDFIGTHRDTYLINPSGEIVKKYTGVDPRTHINDIITDLKNLQ